MDSVEHVRSYLAQFGASDRVIEFTVSSATVELAAKALNCEPGRIAKTLSLAFSQSALTTAIKNVQPEKMVLQSGYA